MATIAFDPLFWLLAVTGVILTGISKSGFAGGAGVVAVPLLALVMPVGTAVALMLPLLLIMDAKSFSYYSRHVSWPLLRPILLAAIIGIAVAGMGMAVISATTLQWLLAVFSLTFALWHKLLPLLGMLPGSAWIWGALSGISSTLLHAGGPPLSIYLLSQSLSKQQWLACAVTFLGIVNLIKLIPYSVNQQWQTDLFVLDLVLLPFAWAGVYLGHKIQHRISEQQFMLVCRMLLGLSGCSLLVKGFY